MDANRFVVCLTIVLMFVMEARAHARQEGPVGEVVLRVVDEGSSDPVANAELRLIWMGHDARVQADASGEHRPAGRCAVAWSIQAASRARMSAYPSRRSAATVCGAEADDHEVVAIPHRLVQGLEALDNDAALPAQYVKDHGMTWTHGFLGKWSDDVVTKAYGVRGIPATFLIGPDGRVVLSNVRGAEAVAAVRSAIENPRPR